MTSTVTMLPSTSCMKQISDPFITTKFCYSMSSNWLPPHTTL